MVRVSPNLIAVHATKSYLVSKTISLLEKDEEVNQLLKMSNVMAVSRLGYNDHGPVHARIVAGAALTLFDYLVDSGIKPTTIRDGTVDDIEKAKVIVTLAAYLHDIGNSIHRFMHEALGSLLAKDILDRILPQLFDKREEIYSIRQEVMHAIISTQFDVLCLTMEAGVVKIGDGLDMAEGRARIPYKLGKIDMHSVSALNIKWVEVEKDGDRPIKITINMEDMAGLFQVEEVLLPKIKTSGLQDKVKIVVLSRGKEFVTFPR